MEAATNTDERVRSAQQLDEIRAFFGPETRIGRKYELVEFIGAGSMGVVCRARDAFIGREVAIKSINLAIDDPELLAQLRERFPREARATGALNHPNIVTVYEAGEELGRYYIVMEYLRGVTLKDLANRPEPLPIRNVISFIRQIAEALDYSHERHIVHRDIKPENIIIVDGTVAKLTDFGIAKVLSSTIADVTRGDRILGTPSYMAPEQVKGLSIDSRTDLFSLGCVFYELLTGRKPFQQSSIGAVLISIISEDPAWLGAIDPRFPKAFDALLKRMLAKNPADRIQSARELVVALDELPAEALAQEVDALRSEQFASRQEHAERKRRPRSAPVSTEKTLQRDTPPPAAVEPTRQLKLTDSMANELRVAYRQGAIDYSEQRWEQAAVQMRTVLRLNPDHELAKQFLSLAERRMELEAQAAPLPSQFEDTVTKLPRVHVEPAPQPASEASSPVAAKASPSPTSARRGRPWAVAIALLVAIIVVVAFVLLGPRRPTDNLSNSGSSSPGTQAERDAPEPPRGSRAWIDSHFQRAKACYESGDDLCFVREIELVLDADPQHEQARDYLQRFWPGRSTAK
ncbi:MAG: protein kinase [Candidatus Schekmanbacteria bacterium]|nr:protein kinase [Candidatus Schekmanbacteria bacterium]